jgi:hypothetical protein
MSEAFQPTEQSQLQSGIAYEYTIDETFVSQTLSCNDTPGSAILETEFKYSSSVEPSVRPARAQAHMASPFKGDC